MRILVIWGESLAKPGGGTAHCRGLCGGLRSAGHEVTILAPCYGPAAVDPALGARCVRLPRRGWLSFLCFQALTVLLLPGWLARYRPQAVYVRTCFLQALMALIAHLAGRPLVAEVDSLVDREILARGQPRWMAAMVYGLDRFNNRFIDGLVCVSRGLRREHLRRGAPPEGVAAIHNGAMVELFKPTDRQAARRELGLPERGVLVGFAGTFAPWQGLDFLVAAAAHLKGPQPTLALMGGGLCGDALRGDIAARGLSERVLFVPPGPVEKVAVFLAACDAAVIPIHDRGKLGYCSPLKFWDALSAGLPVLVARDSEIDEVLAELNLPGVFDPDDPASLAAALADVAENVDRHRRRRQEIHEAVARRYSWRAVAEQVAGLLSRLAERRRRSP
jgi:glycogen(starch) synthase